MANKKTKRQLESHIRNCQWELQSRLNPENKYGYMKGVNYFRKQIEVSKQLLKQYV